MYSRCNYLLFVYFLILPSLLHSSILFNCFYTCIINIYSYATSPLKSVSHLLCKSIWLSDSCTSSRSGHDSTRGFGHSFNFSMLTDGLTFCLNIRNDLKLTPISFDLSIGSLNNLRSRSIGWRYYSTSHRLIL